MPEFPATSPNGVLPAPAQARRRDWLRQGFLTAWEGSESHFFVVHTGVFDYQAPINGQLLPAPEYLALVATTKFSPKMQTIVFWSPDKGFRFLQPSMKETFLATLGMKPAGAPTDAERQAARIMGEELPEPGEVKLPSGARESFDMAAEFLKKAEPASAMVIVENLDLIFPAERTPGLMNESQTATLAMLKRIALDPDFDVAGNPFVCFADSFQGILTELRTAPGVRDIEIGLPTEAERCEFIEAYLLGHPEVKLAEGMTAQQLAALTAGLYCRAIEEIFLNATTVSRKRGIKTGALVTSDQVRAKKKDLMRVEYGDVLEQLDPVGGLEMVGGLVEAKDWFRTWVINPFKTGKGRQSVPVVIELSGPPGTGKTFIAGCVGFDAKVNVIIVRPDRLLGGIVGQSEKFLAKALAGIRAFAPCIVIIDEADQKLRRVVGGTGGGGDSVSANQFGTWLEFLSDPSNAGNIHVMLLTNRPDQLDDALKSRCETRMPILPVKGDEARADILRRQLSAKGIEFDIETLVPLAKRMRDEDGWSGREMAQVVKKAAGLVEVTSMDPLEALHAATNSRKPMASGESEMMTKLAIDECNDLELIPQGYNSTVDSEKLTEDIANLRTRQRQVRGATSIED